MLLHANATNLNVIEAVSHNYIILQICICALPLSLTYSLFGVLIMIIHCLCNNSIDKYINKKKHLHNIYMYQTIVRWGQICLSSVAIEIIPHFQICIVSMNALYVCDVPKS